MRVSSGLARRLLALALAVSGAVALGACARNAKPLIYGVAPSLLPKVTVNTDDPGVSSINLSQELFLLHTQYHLKIEHLKKVLYNGIESSFTTPKRKAILKNEFEEEYGRLVRS